MQSKLATVEKASKKGFANVVWMVVFAVIAFAVLGLVVTYTTDIIQDINDDQTANSYAFNASENALEAQANIADRQETMSNVIMAGAIIMILMAAFGGFALYARK